MQYANAARILPEELLAEIKKYFPGGMLWITESETDRRERDDLIAKLVNNNVPIREIAQLAEITPRHVRRLVRKRAMTQAGPDI